MASSNVLTHNYVMDSSILEGLYDSFNENKSKKVKHVVVSNDNLCLSNKSGDNEYTNITFFKLLNRIKSQESVVPKKLNNYTLTCAEDAALAYMFTLAGLGRIDTVKQTCCFIVSNNAITIETVMFLREVREDSFKKLLYRSMLAKKQLHRYSALNNMMFGEDACSTATKAYIISKLTSEMYGDATREAAYCDDIPGSGACETLDDRKIEDSPTQERLPPDTVVQEPLSYPEEDSPNSYSIFGTLGDNSMRDYTSYESEVAANPGMDELDEDDKWYIAEKLNAVVMQVDHADLSALSKFVSNGRTKALFKCINIGSIIGVKLLIKIGVDVNAKSKLGETALNNAVFFGFEKIVMRLLKAGAHVNSKDAKGCSPIQTAFTVLEKSFFKVFNEYLEVIRTGHAYVCHKDELC